MKNILKQKERTGQDNPKDSEANAAESESGTETIHDGIIEDAENMAEDLASDNNLKKALEEKQKSCDELLDRLQRNMAEFDNFRKRSIKEKASMYDDGVRDIVMKLLPIVDNFERAVAGASAVSEKEADSKTEALRDDSFYKGVEMILKQFYSVLDDIGVSVIPDKGEKFDPNLHYAVAHVEDGGVGDNEIIEVLQKGYKYNEKVIRPSMVKVAN